ncbi:MAG: ABC-2 family transporter protein [Armatimonadota bacterium]
MRRMARVYRRFFLSSLQREMEFRANFVAKVAQNLIWVVTFALLLEVIFRNTASVRGWTKAETYLLAATCFIVEGLVGAFLSASTVEIPQKVRQGTLDFDIVKPIDSQFLACARKFNFDQLGTLVAGVIIALTASRAAGIELTFTGVSAYLVLVLCACVIYGSFLLMLMTTAIWFVRVDNLWVLGDLAIALARYPIDIFGSAAKALLTFVLPLAFLASVPVRILSGASGAVWLLLSAGWAVVFFLVARWFWRFALRHYTSASS